MMEQPKILVGECPVCEWDCLFIVPQEFDLSNAHCSLCLEDNARIVQLQFRQASNDEAARRVQTEHVFDLFTGTRNEQA